MLHLRLQRPPVAAKLLEMHVAAQHGYLMLIMQQIRSHALALTSAGMSKQQQLRHNSPTKCQVQSPLNHQRLQQRCNAHQQQHVSAGCKRHLQHNVRGLCTAPQQGVFHSWQHISWSQQLCARHQHAQTALSASAAFTTAAHGLLHHPPTSSAVHIPTDEQDTAPTLAHAPVTELHHLLQQHQTVARVLDGKSVAAEWSAELQQEVPSISDILGRPPGLAVLLVGSRPDSMLYVSKKEEACQRVGINCKIVRLAESVSQQELQDAVAAAAADTMIDGVLVQLPLPRHLDEESVMGFLDPKKDVDGFHPLNMGRMLMRGRARRFVPATPLGVVELLSRSGVSLAGKTAVILGDSNIVGTPLAALLRDEGAALVTTCHRPSIQDWFEEQAAGQMQRACADVCLPRLPGPGPGSSATMAVAATPQHGKPNSRGFQASQLPAICRTADVLVVAVGNPELVRGDWVKPGAVVVDVGINVVAVNASTSSSAALQQQEQHANINTNNYSATEKQPQQQHSRFQLAQGSMSDAEPALQQQHEQNGCCRSAVDAVTSSHGSLSSMCGGGEYRVVGDVAAHEVAGVASVLTPVPGGVGPMTIAAVLHNTLQAARYTAGLLAW